LFPINLRTMIPAMLWRCQVATCITVWPCKLTSTPTCVE
jgi:hypothetical protein